MGAVNKVGSKVVSHPVHEAGGKGIAPQRPFQLGLNQVHGIAVPNKGGRQGQCPGLGQVHVGSAVEHMAVPLRESTHLATRIDTGRQKVIRGRQLASGFQEAVHIKPGCLFPGGRCFREGLRKGLKGQQGRFAKCLMGISGKEGGVQEYLSETKGRLLVFLFFEMPIQGSRCHGAPGRFQEGSLFPGGSRHHGFPIGLGGLFQGLLFGRRQLQGFQGL